jgi:hypothetical protein
MRTLFISLLSASLVGCTCPPQGLFDGCSSSACLDRTVVAPPLELKPEIKESAPRKDVKPIKAKSTKPVHVASRSSEADHDPSPLTIMKPEFAAPHLQAQASDPVLKKAKTTIAAKMEDPASAEFEGMQRAIRKNTFGQPVDTICGHVKGKKTSGEDTGERPFLYLVKDDEAYVVDDNPDSAAAIAYRNICTSGLDEPAKNVRQQSSRQ